MIVVYFHINALTNEVFYVGIGVGFRPYRKSGRSVLWNRIVEKYGYSVMIVYKCKSWQEAKEKEVLYIKQFGRMDLRTGCLVNHTNGGDGALGGVFNVGSKRSQESRDKISKALKGRKINPLTVAKSTQARNESLALNGFKSHNRGKHLSDEQKAKISDSKRGNKLSDQHKNAISKKLKGRIFSEETRRKNSEGVKRYWQSKKAAA